MDRYLQRYGYVVARVMLAAIFLLTGYDKLVDVEDAAGDIAEIQAAACNIGLLLRRLTGVGTPRSLQGRALAAICHLIDRLIDRWGRLTRVWGFKWTPTALVGSFAHRQAT